MNSVLCILSPAIALWYFKVQVNSVLCNPGIINSYNLLLKLNKFVNRISEYHSSTLF